MTRSRNRNRLWKQHINRLNKAHAAIRHYYFQPSYDPRVCIATLVEVLGVDIRHHTDVVTDVKVSKAW